MAILLTPTGAADAATVLLVRGGTNVAGFDNGMPNFYNNRTGWDAVSIAQSGLAAADVSDTRLLIIYVGAALNLTERAQLGTILSNGGHVMFMGENSNLQGFNTRAAAEIAELGGTIGTQFKVVVGSNEVALRSNNQVFDHPLTVGVDSFAYSAAGSVTGGTALFNRTADWDIAASEPLGGGWVTLLADSNVVPPTNGALPIGGDTYNNDVFFANAVLITTIPEPASALLAMAAAPLIALRRRRTAV